MHCAPPVGQPQNLSLIHIYAILATRNAIHLYFHEGLCCIHKFRAQKVQKERAATLCQCCCPLVRNDRENNTIRGFRFLVELSFGIWCSWVQSGCKTRRIWCTHSFRFAVISERTMARGRKKKFSDYIRTEVARIYRLLHNVGTLRRVPIFHFGCIFIGLTFLCP